MPKWAMRQESEPEGIPKGEKVGEWNGDEGGEIGDLAEVRHDFELEQRLAVVGGPVHVYRGHDEGKDCKDVYCGGH